MSQFDDLNDWLAGVTPQAPVSRQLRPAEPAIATIALVGYIRLWHNRTCDQCGSEHLEHAGTYECYLHPNGSRSARLAKVEPQGDRLLPFLEHYVQRASPVCVECTSPDFEPEGGPLKPFVGLLS